MNKDTKLLMNAINGERCAYNELYKKYFYIVVCFLAKLNGDFHLSEDIAQEIFLQVWNKKIEFKGSSSVKTFLLSVTKNVLAEYKRQENKEVISRQMWILRKDIAPSSSQTQVEYDNAEIIQGVNRAMVHLSQMQRQAIELIYSMELPHRKAAQIANCTEKAFENRLVRAYKKLRQIIHNSEIKNICL